LAGGESTQLVAVPNPSSPPPPPDGISLAAWRQRLYRNRLKNDPQKHKLVKAAAANRAKEYRKRQQRSLSPSKKAELRVKANERLRKFREKQKLNGDTAQKKKPATRGTTDSRREKDRLRQKKYRASLSANKKTAIKKWYRDKATQAKIGVASPAQDPPSESLQETPVSYRTSSAKRKAVQKATLSMPDSPTKYATVCQGLQSTKSPLPSFGDIGDSCPVS